MIPVISETLLIMIIDSSMHNKDDEIKLLTPPALELEDHSPRVVKLKITYCRPTPGNTLDVLYFDVCLLYKSHRNQQSSN